MFSSLNKIQKIVICSLMLFSLTLFAIGSVLFTWLENKNTSIIIMICGAIMCVCTSIVWIIFSKWFKHNKKEVLTWD